MGDRSSWAGGWKEGGREEQGELCNWTATAVGAVQAAVAMIMRGEETPTTSTYLVTPCQPPDNRPATGARSHSLLCALG